MSPREKRQQHRDRIRAEILRLKATGRSYEEIAPLLSRKFKMDLNGKGAVHYYASAIPNMERRCPACLREHETTK